MVTLTLTPEQLQRLMLHASARNVPLEGALDAVLAADPPARRPWSEEELQLLRNPKNRPSDLARRFGRTTQAVSVKRNEIAHSEGRPELLRRQQPEALARAQAELQAEQDRRARLPEDHLYKHVVISRLNAYQRKGKRCEYCDRSPVWCFVTDSERVVGYYCNDCVPGPQETG